MAPVLSHYLFRADVQSADGLIELSVEITGYFTPTQLPGRRPLAEHAAAELLSARAFFTVWPGPKDKIYHVDGLATLQVVSRTFRSATPTRGLIQLAYTLRECE